MTVLSFLLAWAWIAIHLIGIAALMFVVSFLGLLGIALFVLLLTGAITDPLHYLIALGVLLVIVSGFAAMYGDHS